MNRTHKLKAYVSSIMALSGGIWLVSLGDNLGWIGIVAGTFVGGFVVFDNRRRY